MWNRYKDMEDQVVKRWLESDEGDIISIVTGNTKGNMRLGIDGEIRCSIGSECFIIPCTLSMVERKSDDEIIKVAEKRYNLINS